MYAAIPTMERVRDSALAKTIGTFIMGAGTALAYTNAAAKAGDIKDKYFELYKERTKIPHFIPQQNYWGELSMDMGILTALTLEIIGMEFTYNKLSEGQLAQGLAYPAAKVVTHGLAWLVDRYSRK